MEECQHKPLEGAVIYRWIRVTSRSEMTRVSDEQFCVICRKPFDTNGPLKSADRVVKEAAAGLSEAPEPRRPAAAPMAPPTARQVAPSVPLDAPVSASPADPYQPVPLDPSGALQPRRRGRPPGSKNRKK